MSIKIGDHVRTTQHGYIGVVFEELYLDETWDDWVADLIIPLTAEERVDSGGAIIAPEASCSITDS
jgi:hypothetical protein